VSVSVITAVGRYSRMLSSLALFTLNRELAFRGNFLVKVSVEVLWLAILVAFYEVVFGRTNNVATWSKPQMMFFVGCFFALNGLIEMLFLENCNEFAELVRSGDLDGLLLKPIDEQFLISCRRVDWGTAPNVLMGGVVMISSLFQLHWQFDLVKLVTFFVTFVCGTAIAYAFMLMLTSLSVWMVRNQSLMEMWWLFSSLARYPKEIFAGSWATPLGVFFTYFVPILVVVNVPANAMVRVLDPIMVVLTVVATVLLLWLSRKFFMHALRSYRSASS
jgi:ABC-2 type transport system permease protein